MPISNEELLQKANLDLSAFGGAGEAALSVEAANEFIAQMYAEQAMLGDVRTVFSNANKWQEASFDFASRIAKPGVEFTRLVSGDRSAPSTRMVEISTVLLRAEVPVSDEVFEDNVAGQRLDPALRRDIAIRFGLDVEELLINGDTGSGDPYLALLEGWLEQAVSGGQVVAAASYAQDYQALMGRMITALPDRYKRMIEVDGRFYVPKRLEEKWRQQLADRGTAVGDRMLLEGGALRFGGIEVRGVPNIAITAGTPDVSRILLTNRNNLYAGIRRQITLETFRDPREGGMSYVVTARVDAKIGVPAATVVATNVDVEP